MSNNKYDIVNKGKKKPHKRKNVQIRTFSYEDMDSSLRFHEEKKRQKKNNWRQYLPDDE